MTFFSSKNIPIYYYYIVSFQQSNFELIGNVGDIHPLLLFPIPADGNSKIEDKQTGLERSCKEREGKVFYGQEFPKEEFRLVVFSAFVFLQYRARFSWCTFS